MNIVSQKTIGTKILLDTAKILPGTIRIVGLAPFTVSMDGIEVEVKGGFPFGELGYGEVEGVYYEKIIPKTRVTEELFPLNLAAVAAFLYMQHNPLHAQELIFQVGDGLGLFQFEFTAVAASHILRSFQIYRRLDE